MTSFVAITGDLHANSSVGLCAPGQYHDDGQPIELSKTQLQLWEWWLEYCGGIRRAAGSNRVIGIVNGDAGDVNKHSKFQLIEPSNPAVQLRITRATLKPFRDVCDDIIIIRGTEAHGGGSNWLEEKLAEDIGAHPYGHTGSHSWWFLEATIEGVNIAAAHHPGTNSMRPWTQGGGANRAAAMMVYNYYGAAWAPDLAIFNHVHHNEDSGDTHPVRVIFNRSWTLQNAYDHRGGRSLQTPRIGSMVIEVDGGDYVVHKFKREMMKPEPLCL